MLTNPEKSVDSNLSWEVKETASDVQSDLLSSNWSFSSESTSDNKESERNWRGNNRKWKSIAQNVMFIYTFLANKKQLKNGQNMVKKATMCLTGYYQFANGLIITSASCVMSPSPGVIMMLFEIFVAFSNCLSYIFQVYITFT